VLNSLNLLIEMFGTKRRVGNHSVREKKRMGLHEFSSFTSDVKQWRNFKFWPF